MYLNGRHEPAIHEVCDISDKEEFSIFRVIWWLLATTMSETISSKFTTGGALTPASRMVYNDSKIAS
jgi:hypothetical protein